MDASAYRVHSAVYFFLIMIIYTNLKLLKLDYLRNKKGECVESEKCKGPPQCTECKQNEYYTDCGTDCGRICTDIGKDKVKCKGTACHPGCLCKWGFFRTPDGECVTKNECQFFIDEDNQGIDYIITDDPDGIQSPGMSRHKKVAAEGNGTETEKVMSRSKKRTKNFEMGDDPGQDYYDHEYDEYSGDFGTLDGSRREQEHYRTHGRRWKPSHQRSQGQYRFEEPVPNAEIIGPNGRPSRMTPKDYRSFGYKNYD